jgi:hypothetical protein
MIASHDAALRALLLVAPGELGTLEAAQMSAWGVRRAKAASVSG